SGSVIVKFKKITPFIRCKIIFQFKLYSITVMKNISIAHRINLPWVESPFFNTLLSEKKLSPQQKDIATHFNREGFIVLPQQVSHELIDQTLLEIQGEYPDRVGQEPARLQDLWKKYNTVRNIAG